MKRSKWDQRMQRADELAATHPFATDVLQFYKRIARLQKELYSYIERVWGEPSERRVSGLVRKDLNLHLLLPEFPEFLSSVEAVAPALLPDLRLICARSSAINGRICSPPVGEALRISSLIQVTLRPCWNGCFCSPTQSTSPIIVNPCLVTRPWQFVLFALKSPLSACCGPRGTGENGL